MKLHFFLFVSFTCFPFSSQYLPWARRACPVGCLWEGTGPTKMSAWLIPAKLCAMLHFPIFPQKGHTVGSPFLLHQCWFSRDQKFQQCVCTTCPNVPLNWNRNCHDQQPLWPQSPFSPGKQRQEFCLSHFPILLQMWTDSVPLIALSTNLCLILPFLLCLQTSCLGLLSSALPALETFFMVCLQPW